MTKFWTSASKARLSWLAAGIVMIVCLASTAPAADAISSKIEVTSPVGKGLSGEEWRAISLSAGNVLKHVDQALEALTNKQNKAATANIDKALTLVKIMEGSLQPTVVKTEIKGAGLTYQDQESIKPAFVPIYREYDQVDILSPVIAQKQQAGAKSATTESKSALQYTYAGLDYTDIKLNLRLAMRDLLLAQNSIKENDIKAATAALQEIQAVGVIFEFSTIREPLTRAMDNLRLAESELKSKHPEQAKIAMAGATDALKNYEKLVGDSRSKEVAKLHKEVDEVAKNISKEEGEAVFNKVSEWWNKMWGWSNK